MSGRRLDCPPCLFLARKKSNQKKDAKDARNLGHFESTCSGCEQTVGEICGASQPTVKLRVLSTCCTPAGLRSLNLRFRGKDQPRLLSFVPEPVLRRLSGRYRNFR